MKRDLSEDHMSHTDLFRPGCNSLFLGLDSRFCPGVISKQSPDSIFSILIGIERLSQLVVCFSSRNGRLTGRRRCRQHGWGEHKQQQRKATAHTGRNAPLPPVAVCVLTRRAGVMHPTAALHRQQSLWLHHNSRGKQLQVNTLAPHVKHEHELWTFKKTRKKKNFLGRAPRSRDGLMESCTCRCHVMVWYLFAGEPLRSGFLRTIVAMTRQWVPCIL